MFAKKEDLMTSTESAQQAGRASWSGKLAFVLAAAASAVGLGSMCASPIWLQNMVAALSC
mgnify:CR=1 FL=1